MKIADANKQGYIFIVFLMALSLLFSGIGCGGGGGDSSSSASVDDGALPGGGIAFRVQWEDLDRNPNVRVAGLDCESAGVFEVTAEVYGYQTDPSHTDGSDDSTSPDRIETEPVLDGSEVLLASGGPWECSAHSATIDNVPPGPERRVVVKGLDSEGNTLYSGEARGLTVESGGVTDAGLIEAFAMLSIDFRYLQYRTYADSTQNQYRGDIGLSKSGRPVQPRDVRKIELKDSTGNPVPTQAPELYLGESFTGVFDPDAGEVELSGPNPSSDYLIRFPEETLLSEGNYTWEITAASGQVLRETVYFPGSVAAPVTPESSMSHNWLSDGDLLLSWSSPAGEYQDINLLIMDQDWNDLAYISLPPDTVEMVIPAEEIRKITNLHQPIRAKWIVRNRLITEENMNYARSYSDTLEFPWNDVTIDFIDYFPLALGNERLTSSSSGSISKEEVIGTESINGVQAYQQAYFHEDYADMTEIEDMDLISYDSAYVYFHGTRQFAGPPWTESPPGFYQNNPPLQFDRYMSVGDSRTSTTIVKLPDGGTLARSFTFEILGFEDTNTPYGFFPNCLKLKRIDEIEDGTPEESHAWHVKGVGDVRDEEYSDGVFNRGEALLNATIIGNVDNLSIPWTPQFRYNVHTDSTRNNFFGYMGIKKNGIGVNQEDIDDIKLRRSDYAEVSISDLTFYDYLYYGASWNESSQQFDFWGPRYEKEWGVTFPDGADYETGYYVWEVIAANGKVVTYRFYFPGKRELPIHDSALMNYEWLADGSLRLRWVNPAGDYDRVQIALLTQDGRNVFFSTFDREYDIEEIIIPAEGIADVRSNIDNFTFMKWTMRTRARSAEGVNYARGYSDVIEIPFEETPITNLCIQDYKVPSPEFSINVFSCQSSGGATLNSGVSTWIRMSIGDYATEADALADQSFASFNVVLGGDILPQDGETLVQYNDGMGFWEINSYHCTGNLPPGTYTLTGRSSLYTEPLDSASCQITIVSK
jgi:hypothetical protein